MTAKDHWDQVYKTKSPTSVSWYREHLNISLDLIRRSNVASNASIIDIGGGASTLVDDLLQLDFTNLRVLDISRLALEEAKRRLGDRASEVVWLEGDIREIDLGGRTIDLWHDRAVFHFLTDAVDRRAYVRSVSRSVRAPGFLIIATFAADGPTSCSGLPVMRYSADALAQQFPEFRLLEARREVHTTPSGTAQNFTYVLLQREN